MAVTETTLTALRAVLHNVEYLAKRQADSPTDRTICRHITRDLRKLEAELDEMLDQAAAADVARRFSQPATGDRP